MGGIASIEGGTGRASHRRVRGALPKKGCVLTKIGFANASIPSPFPTKAQGALAIEGADAPYEDWLCQYFYPLRNFQYKKRTSHERFVNTSGVRFKKPQLPRFGAMILELKTGRKRNGGLKRIKHTRKSPLSVIPQKNEPPMRGSSALSEFVPKNQGYPIWRNDFG